MDQQLAAHKEMEWQEGGRREGGIEVNGYNMEGRAKPKGNDNHTKATNMYENYKKEYTVKSIKKNKCSRLVTK